MRAQPVWKDTDHCAEIEQLYLRLASVNESIAELNRTHPESETLEGLKAGALSLTRQIDDLRCSIADEQLAGLLAR